MGIAARSRERVEGRIASLEAVYGSFPVSQTTISLPASRYERARELYHDADLIDVYAQVRNDEGDVLHVDGEGQPALPGTAVGTHTSLEDAVRDAVEGQTGVRCQVDGLETVTIAGLRNDDDPDGDTLYRLVVVFSASCEGGVPNAQAAWEPAVRSGQPVVA